MKKLAQLASVSLMVVLLALSFNANAQDGLQEMTWDEYGIEFVAPADFDLIQNDAKAFTAKGAAFTLSIKPWKDASITDPLDIAQKAFDITPGTEKTVEIEKPIKI